MMGCDYIFGKSMMKNTQSPQMTWLLQFVAEVWAFLGPIISIQNLLIFLGVIRLGPNAN